jgi:hypothetical protein
VPLDPSGDDLEGLDEVSLWRDFARILLGLATDDRPDHHVDVRLLAKRARRISKALSGRRRRERGEEEEDRP